jgi:hypothetical protein
MTDKYHGDNRETYESISYAPGIKDTGDLEPGTKTIIRTAEANGTNNADYSAPVTIIVPADPRLVINRIATRISVTIDGDDGTHDLRCRVYVEAQDSDHLLFDLSFTTTGNQLSTQGMLAGTKETIFNLLKDGNGHTLYFFCWTPGGHNPSISLMELWAGVGYGGTSYSIPCLTLNFTGLFSLYWWVNRIGTGNIDSRLSSNSGATLNGFIASVSAGTSNTGMLPCGILINPAISTRCATATDLSYVDNVRFIMRSEN